MQCPQIYYLSGIIVVHVAIQTAVNSKIPNTSSAPVTHTVHQNITVTSIVTMTNSPDCSPSASLPSTNTSSGISEGSRSNGSVVLGILGGLIFVLGVTVLGLSLGVIYYRKESRSYR